MTKLGKDRIKTQKKQQRKKTPADGDDDIDYNSDEDVSPPKFDTKKWFEELNVTAPQDETEVKISQLEALRREAKALMDEHVALNGSKPPKSISSSDYVWMKTVMAKGTKSDKIAAYVVLVQDSPICNLNLLNNMIGMVKVGKKEWTLAAESLQELFLNDLLPPHRKLNLLSQQPVAQLDKISSGVEFKRKQILLYWYFENQLKVTYRDFVCALNQIAHDAVDADKEKAVTVMFKLLEGNPEQESALLSNIVNKLGDPSHKVGSKVIYTLTKLLQTHPNMREVVMEEVEKLLFRPNISKRAQYYGVCFLAQFCLSNNDGKLAKKLIAIYISIFKACIKMGEIDSRMMSALLTGVNRAYPFTKDDANVLGDQINTIYKVVHFGKPNVAIQALCLLFLMSSQTETVTDRFFMVLYKKILEPKLFTSTHHAMLLSLIYRALKKDKSHERICSFFKRLLQVSTHLSAPIVCGILFIISEIVATKKNILLTEHKGQCDKPSNLAFKEEDRVDDDDEEHYEDVEFESNTQNHISMRKKSKSDAPLVTNAQLSVKRVESENLKVWRNPDVTPEDRGKSEATEYDPNHRNPLYAAGNKSVLSELYQLAKHYHPSVSCFATNILNGKRINYSGDPLQDFALIRFLDKFSFKNPKTLKQENEESQTFSKFGKRKMYSHIIATRLKGNEEYLKHSASNIPADEKFIYSYLKVKEADGGIRGDKDDDSDVESVASDEFEGMIHKMFGKPDDGNDDDIDFMNEAGQLSKREPMKDAEEDEGGSEEEPEMSDGDGSFAEDFDGDEMDEGGDSDDYLEGSELDESELPPELRDFGGSKMGGQNKSKRKLEKFAKDNLFATAEEFSELLEQTDRHAGGSHAVSNRDDAGQKQLKWEAQRNDKFRKDYRKKKFKRSAPGVDSERRGAKKRRR